MSEWKPDRIKELRQSLKLSQEAFGAMIGVVREHVNRLEKGVRLPNKTMQILFDCIEQKEMKKEGERGRKRKVPKGNI